MSDAQQPVTREDLDRVADRLSAQFSERFAAMAPSLISV
jgi:hypothetical protein